MDIHRHISDMRSETNSCFFVIEKYWKKYQYASKFVQLVKSKTPKVTLYTKYAKVMLMENSPTADLEVCFYDGESSMDFRSLTRRRNWQ